MNMSAYCCPGWYEIAANFCVFHRTVRESKWNQRLVAQQLKNCGPDVRQTVEHNAQHICRYRKVHRLQNTMLRQAVDQVPFYQRSVLSFTLKIYLLCNYGQFWEVQMLRDLHFDLGLEDKVKSTYTVHVELSFSVPNHMTIASRTTEYGHLKFVKYRHLANFKLLC